MVDLLLQGVCNERQDLLILVEKQACSKMAKSLVCKSWRRQKLDTFDLPEMRTLAEGEKIEKLGYVVAPVDEDIVSEPERRGGCITRA